MRSKSFGTQSLEAGDRLGGIFMSCLNSALRMQETAPLNLDGLQSLCSALTAAALQESDDPLSVSEYMKVLPLTPPEA